jgi:flavin reductase (DIM6/NTAB) family NADH-FMN oxidoreductase RutF
MRGMDVLSAFWSPLCAVGSHGPKGPNAQICVSVFGASIVPDRPRVLVVLHKTNYTHDLVTTAGTLAVTALGEGQSDLLEPLGLASGRDGDKLDGLCYVTTGAGDPYFPGGAGFLEGEMLDTFDLGDATAFLTAVRSRETWEAAPLRWHEVKESIGEEFMARWTEKSAREQAAAREMMLWR